MLPLTKGRRVRGAGLAACVAGGAQDAPWRVIGKLDPHLGRYGAALQARIAERGMQTRVTLLPDANGAELRAACERAAALVMLSRHEGFCVPLVEAMALGTPVIAFASSAIPGPLGGGGLLWVSPDPHLFPASVARCPSAGELRPPLGRATERQRVQGPVSTAADWPRLEWIRSATATGDKA